jgi:dinuclear metal center YbgI/SA1388 family protein
MLVTVGEIAEFLEILAPTRWAADWDRIGLQLGRPDREVSRVVLALDANLRALRRAWLEGAQLIVAHHPLIFRPLTEIRTDTAPGLLISELLRAEVAVYAAHTNLDCAPRVGPAAVLAERLGLREVRPLVACPGEAGAGILGGDREGAFPTTSEFPGGAGEAGLGRVGRLPRALSAEELARAVAQALGVPAVAIAGQGTMETVALLPGAGGEGVAPALAAGAQALVTGELDYHETSDAVAAGLTILAAGHAESEALLLPALAAALAERFGESLGISVEPPAATWRNGC